MHFLIESQTTPIFLPELAAPIAPSLPVTSVSPVDELPAIAPIALVVPRPKVQRHSFSDSKGASDIKAMITGRTPSASFTMPASAAYTIIGGSRGSVKVLETKPTSPVPEVAIELEAEDDGSEDSEELASPLSILRPVSPARSISNFKELNAFPLGPKESISRSPSPSPSVRFAELPTFEDEADAEFDENVEEHEEHEAEILTAARAPVPAAAPSVDPYAPLSPSPTYPTRPRVPLSLDTSTYTVPPRPNSPTPRFVQHTNNLLLPLPVSSPTATSHSLVSITAIPQSLLRSGLLLPHFLSSSVGGLFFSSLGSIGMRARSSSVSSEKSVGGTSKGVFGTVASLLWGGWGKGDSSLLPTTEKGLASLVQTSAAAGGAVAGRGI